MEFEIVFADGTALTVDGILPSWHRVAFRCLMNTKTCPSPRLLHEHVFAQEAPGARRFVEES